MGQRVLGFGGRASSVCVCVYVGVCASVEVCVAVCMDV